MLPRPTDPDEEVVALMQEVGPGEAVELAVTDFKNAHHHLNVHPEELQNCLVAEPGGERQDGRPGVAIMVRMGCGSKGAPLT